MSQHPSEKPTGPTPSLPATQQSLAAARPIPLVRLILHSGAFMDLMFVVRTIMELIHFCQAEATNKMWEAHHFGRSQLLVTYRERAEWFAEQFAARGLTVTIEPA